MLDEATINQLSRGYVCPPDAGPAWRAAMQAGVDMSQLQDKLALIQLKAIRDRPRG